MARTAIPSSFNDMHTAFVTTDEGILLAELVQVLACVSVTPLLTPLLIPWVVPPTFAKQAAYDKNFLFLIKAIVEYPVLAVFPVWAVTLFAGADVDKNNSSYLRSSGVVFIVLLCVAVGILVVNHAVTAPKWLGFSRHWEKIKHLPTGWISEISSKSNTTPSPQGQGRLLFITNYRAIVIYITILCILAVDFPIFPRRFAKTKTYGISLMDVGTGCFVFANGIVAPEARSRKSPLSKSLKSTIPIIILGFIRLVSVKGIEYQEVVEEYGVHWNFFFTLAGVKILSSLLFTVFDSAHGLKLATAISIIYEIILSYNNLQNAYIMNNSVLRENLIDANREGIFSLVGYLSIYLASVYVGKLLYWEKKVSVHDWTKYTLRTFAQLIVMWTLYYIATLYGIFPCRRTANMGYILLMVAVNYSLLWFQMFLALILVCLQHIGLIYGPLVFYEMAALQRRETDRIRNLQQMAKDFSKRQQPENDNEAEDLDAQLEILEKKLEEAFALLKQRAPSSVSDRDLLEKIALIEAEIKSLENKLSDDSSDTEQHEDYDRGNIVLMPDLSKCPIILEAICYNALAVFLLGNLLTGLINCAIYTMYTSAYLSLCYLWLYATVLTAFSLVMYWYKIQLKFW